MRVREGDFIETKDGLIFDVKGLVHPLNRVIAYLRYLKSPRGNRRRGRDRYLKVYSLPERDKILKERYPQYYYYDPVFGCYMQGVTHERILKVYRPQDTILRLLEKRHEIDKVEEDALGLAELIHDSAGISLNRLGISGSVMVNLHNPDSDIDLIVYGRRSCIKVHETLQSLMEENSVVSRYSIKDLKRLFLFRSKDTSMPWRDFLRVERRKSMQGKFKGRDFFIRFVLDWDEFNERYGDKIYRPVGYSEIEATVIDASDSIFTPCIYVLDKVKILKGESVTDLREVVSFRGRFCQQAEDGDIIVARGKVELVTEKGGDQYYRLVVGNKRSDYMIPKHL
ncbi:hypothetical protein CW702_03095 [Candidatus Bathyarchaeota archaeon]|nr:MAG: hypothetical protein CW702_03095 [Candidatus Bathyarchaeota archaeon]